MTAKEYLRQLNMMRRQIISIRAKMEELYYAASGVGAIRYDKERVQTSPEDNLLVTMAELDELEGIYKGKVVQYHKAVQRIMEEINGLEDPVHVQILTARYCDGMSFEKIACEFAFSYRHVLRLHGHALQEFAKKYHDKLSLNVT